MKYMEEKTFVVLLVSQEPVVYSWIYFVKSLRELKALHISLLAGSDLSALGAACSVFLCLDPIYVLNPYLNVQ